jgi:hypothetical protein
MGPADLRAQAATVTTAYSEGRIPKDAGVALQQALEAGAVAMEEYSELANKVGAKFVAELKQLPIPTIDEPAVVTVSRQLVDGHGKPMVSLSVGSRGVDVAFGPDEATIPAETK